MPINLTGNASVTNSFSISTASTITITDDDDGPSVAFAFSADSIEENSSTDVTLTATLSQASEKAVSIPYTMSGTATITDEYTITASPINIAAGDTTGTITISTDGLDDSEVEIIETIILTFGTLVNATSETTDVTLNLLSDDNPTLNSIEYDNTSFAEHQTIKITGTISEAHSKDITIPISFSGTTTYGIDFSTEFSSKNEVSLSSGDTKSFLSADNEKIDTEDVNLFKLGLNIGLGVEYNLVGNTSLLVGLNWINGFTNVLKKKSNEIFYNSNSNSIIFYFNSIVPPIF